VEKPLRGLPEPAEGEEPGEDGEDGVGAEQGQGEGHESIIARRMGGDENGR